MEHKAIVKMKKLKKIKWPAILHISLALFATCNSYAQAPYDFSVGVRAGYSNGLTFKYFLNSKYAADINALYNRNGFQLTGLYEYQFTPHDRKQLQYYVGAGPYGGNWDGNMAIGAALVLGAEYIIRKVPLVIGLDWKPMVNVYRNLDAAPADFGVSIEVLIK